MNRKPLIKQLLKPVSPRKPCKITTLLECKTFDTGSIFWTGERALTMLVPENSDKQVSGLVGG